MTTGGRSVGIVGGGLAGLAAAAALVQRGFRVEVFEAKRHLGGRAGSFVDPATGEMVDHCQHVAMGCCTEFLEFIRRTGVERFFRHDEVLHFFSPEGKQFNVRDSRWIPAPLHLVPALAKLDYLSWRDKLDIARAMLALVRYRTTETNNSPSIGQWLRGRRQSPRAMQRFWQVVLVSALGEELDRASIAAARKVFVDGFLASRSGYQLYVPQAPLGEIYERGIARWLRERRAEIRTGAPVTVGRTSNSVHRLFVQLSDGEVHPFDIIIVAVGWKVLASVLPPDRFPELTPIVEAANSLAGSPITSVHLWLDRPITSLPHAVLIDRLTQWVFARGANWEGEAPAEPCSALDAAPSSSLRDSGSAGASPSHYYQIVISASHTLAGRERDDIVREVLADLAAVFPAAKDAQVVRWRMLSQPDAVFSFRPGLDAIRPAQRTAIDNLFLAGDWTATGWPSTMESAVRSGNLAAEEIARLAS